MVMSRRLQLIDDQIQRTLQDMTAGVQKVLEAMRKHAGDGQDTEALRAKVDALLLARLSDELARLSSAIELTRSKITTELTHRDEQLEKNRHALHKVWAETSKQARALSFWSKVLVVATFLYAFLLGSLLWTAWKQFDLTQQHIQQPAITESQAGPR